MYSAKLAQWGLGEAVVGELLAEGEAILSLSAASAGIGTESEAVPGLECDNSRCARLEAEAIFGARLIRQLKGRLDMFDEVEEQLRQILSDNMKIDKNLVQKGSKLEDWGGDSLQFLETVFEIETHFGISFPDMQNEKISDFDGLVRIVKTAIEASKNGTP
jgi:acyl carrier protein